MTLAADIEGVDRLVDTLDAAAATLTGLDLDGVGRDLVAAVVPRTPYRTGRLASSVHAVVTDDMVTVTAGGPGVGYAGLVHARNPWIADTIAATADHTIDQVTDLVETALSDIQGA